MNLNKIKLHIAGFDIYPIPTGIFGLDGGAMFGTVPKVLWEKTNPADQENRIEMEARALLLVGKNKKILIDTGNGSDFIQKYGEKLGRKFSEIYKVNDKQTDLLQSLKKFGVSPDDITDVILTHLHFDHAGGSTCYRQDKVTATFSRAKYYVQKFNFLTAMNPNKREQASYLKANFIPLMEEHKLILLDQHTGLDIIDPHLHAITSDGHTVAHQSVLIEDRETQLIYCGDVIPTSTHIRSAWVMGYDLNPLKIMEEKKQLLEKSKNKTTYFFFEHDPYCDVATVEPIEKSDEFKIKERFWLYDKIS